ncbi:Integral membrane protein 2C [Desmophyllum pertusum]|uniref:Membrane protein BRI3 n=1 Tax=Desmophyllum pertusum TaxID=174260 RepID=A0A9W9YGF1_9CNID|nr:Integral membrane protein 2C [Desmophyllum pertusum]
MSAPPPYAPVAAGQQGYQQVPQAYQQVPQGYQQVPQGYQQGPPVTNAPGYQGGAPPGYQPIPVQPAPTTYVYVRGNCPACHTGTLRDEYTGLGLFLAIFFFPIGILCCLMLTEKRCTHCGMSYT